MPSAGASEDYGWQATPLSHAKLLRGVTATAKPTTVDEVQLPESELAAAVHDYARRELPRRTYNHSMRVYYYGCAIARQLLPACEPMLETFFLTAMLHDIGTAPENLGATRLSFEYYGAFLALDLLEKHLGGPREQTESVAEAIIRHQDLGETGATTLCTALIQLATVFGEAHPVLDVKWGLGVLSP